MSAYERLAADVADKKAPRDMSAVWERLTPLDRAPEEVQLRVEKVCAAKRIEFDALVALETRIAIRGRGPNVELAWPGYGRGLTGRRTVTAVKYRDVDTGRRRAEPGSVFFELLIAGDRTASEWFLAEGETDAARLVGLLGDVAAVGVLPAGALTFKPEWVAGIPRGATVYLAHDADASGDKGADKARAALGGRTVRVRPPDGAKDWCDWPGDREAFVQLVRDAKRLTRSRVKSYDELLEQYALERSGGDQFEPVRLGFGSLDADLRGISAGQVCGVAARTAVGKSWALASVAETFAGRRDVGSLVLSLEMPGTEWAERQLAIHADVAPEAIEEAARRGELGPLAGGFLERMQNARVVDEPLDFEALPDVFADARQRLTVPLRLVLIDYLGLLSATGRDAYERASALGKGLKTVAKSEQVAVVVAMQLSRAGGDGSEPVTMAMLRDSGVLEESLDFLLGAWRPGKKIGLGPSEHDELRDVMRVAILKNRKGQDGRTVDLRFRSESRRLYEPTEAT